LGAPKVTVITACYNKARTIEGTIKSVLAQTYDNIEYIIVDAQSDDGTYDIINKYSSAIGRWMREPDTGIADAWNKGIAASTGDIIGILNADDWYHPDAVIRAVEAFAENPGYGFIFGDLAVVLEQGDKQYCLKGDPNYGAMICKDMPSIPHPTVFVRRAVYEKCGLFDLSYRVSLDYEFLLRIHKAGVNGFYVAQTLATMRLGGVSDTGYVQSHRETSWISIKYGCNSWLAMGRCYFKIVKSAVRRALEFVGIKGVSRTYRRLTAKPHCYENED
jgi:glycosyltransferase involved in cell wall biosynthesis